MSTRRTRKVHTCKHSSQEQTLYIVLCPICPVKRCRTSTGEAQESSFSALYKFRGHFIIYIRSHSKRHFSLFGQLVLLVICWKDTRRTGTLTTEYFNIDCRSSGALQLTHYTTFPTSWVQIKSPNSLILNIRSHPCVASTLLFLLTVH